MINQAQNSPNFGAIKLSSNDRVFAKKVHTHLINVGYNNAGVDEVDIGRRTLQQKQKDIKEF